MTFLNSKKKVLPQEPTPCFFVVSSCYFFAFYEQAKHCSACKTSLIMLLSLSVRDLSQSRDFSRSKGLSSSQGLLGFHNGVSFCPSGGGGGEGVVLEQYSGVSGPLRVWNLTQFRTKNPLIRALSVGQHSQFYYILFRTKDKLHVVLLKKIHFRVIAFVFLEWKQISSSKLDQSCRWYPVHN